MISFPPEKNRSKKLISKLTKEIKIFQKCHVNIINNVRVKRIKVGEIRDRKLKII
jgi:hypothetical protein